MFWDLTTDFIVSHILAKALTKLSLTSALKVQCCLLLLQPYSWADLTPLALSQEMEELWMDAVITLVVRGLQWGLILSKKQLLLELYVISWVYILLLFTKLDRLYIKDGQKLIWSLNVSNFPTTNWPDVDKRTEFSLKLESFVIRYSCSICVLSWHWNLIPRHIKYLNFEHQNQSTEVLDVPVQLAKQEAMLICQIISLKCSKRLKHGKHDWEVQISYLI